MGNLGKGFKLLVLMPIRTKDPEYSNAFAIAST